MIIVLAAAPWSGMVNAYPPLGLGYLAAVLRGDPSLDARVKIIDFGLYPSMTPKQALECIFSDGRPDILGFSCLTNNLPATLELARMAKDAHPGLKTILGGPHPSADPESVAACEEVDAVVFGEGEITFVDLVKKLTEGAWVEQVPGVAFSLHGEVVKNPSRALIADLDGLPFPARDLMKMQEYSLRAGDGLPIFTLLTSRGCPYNCAYCYKGIFGRKYRARSAENVLAEIEALVSEYKARHLYFGDDIFMIDAARVRAICEGMLKMGSPLSWSCLARVDTVTPELLEAMKRAGCVRIHYGIESGNSEILERIGKKIDLAAVIQSIRWTREAGIQSKGYFMAGLPGDTQETLEETFRFARELPLDEVMFSLATPFPGTRLWEELVAKEGRPDPKDFHRAFYFDDGAGRVQVFFNLSQVASPDLEAFVNRAQKYFKYRKDSADFKRRYGSLLGPAAHWAWRLREGKRQRR